MKRQIVRRSVAAQGMEGKHGDKQDVQDDDQEQGHMGPSLVPGQFVLDRLQFPLLGERVAVLGPHGFSSG